MNYSIECQYCGEVWNTIMYSKHDIAELKCSCGETKNLIAKKVETNDVFGYRFSPDFPDKTKEKQYVKEDTDGFHYLRGYNSLLD